MRDKNLRLDRGHFDRARLPSVQSYFSSCGIRLRGGGAWRDANCPFHDDHRPSLRVRADTGAFRCMACGAHGGDLLAFHMQRTGKRFVEAARDLGAWV
jgi:DNA primase